MLSDYMLMIHCLWNDVECIPEILKLVPESIAEPTIKRLERIDKAIRQIMQPSQQKPKEEERNKAPHLATEFVEYDFFYYLVENYPEGETYFSKWDYATLEASPTQGIRYYDTKRKKNIVHVMIKGAPFENKLPNAGKLTKVSLQKCEGGIIIDSIPYTFRRKFEQAESFGLFQGILSESKLEHGYLLVQLTQLRLLILRQIGSSPDTAVRVISKKHLGQEGVCSDWVHKFPRVFCIFMQNFD